MQQMISTADLIACSRCFVHHYAHHQELESIKQVVPACGIWCLFFNLSVWCGAEQRYRTLAHRLICRHDIDHVINDEHNRTIIVVLAKHEITP